mgnify:CR=1 FL=1
MRDISCLVAPILVHAFFEQAEFERLFGDDFFQLAGFAAQILHLVCRCRPCRVTLKTALAGIEELLRPAVVQVTLPPIGTRL